MWGPKKEAEAAPPALGKEATSASTPGGGQRSERRPLLVPFAFLFHIRKGVGGGFPAGPPGGPLAAGAQSGLPGELARLLPIPGRASGDPPLGSGDFPRSKPLLLPLREETHRVRPSQSLFSTQSPSKASTDIPLSRMGN